MVQEGIYDGSIANYYFYVWGGASASVISSNVSLEKNNSLNVIPEDKITINSKYCLITIDSTTPVYYTYIPLKAKEIIIKQKTLKQAELIDGKYVIDYSTCKPTKSYCIGIGTRNEDYTVDGFSYEYKDKFENYQYTSENGNKKIFNGNKYYKCIGGTFDYIYQVHSYYKSEIDSVSGVKWDANYNDTVLGTDLIMSAKIKSTSDMIYFIRNSTALSGSAIGTSTSITTFKEGKIIKTGNYYMDKKKNWQYPLASYYQFSEITRKYDTKYDYAFSFPYDFIWREKGNSKWLDSSVFSGKKLKEYLSTGITLEMRFEVVHDYHSKGQGLDGETEYPVIWADRFGVPQRVNIKKAKEPKAPKIKFNLSKEILTIKNGMQYSFDKKNWVTIYPYMNTRSKKGQIYLDIFEGYNYGEIWNWTECGQDYGRTSDGVKWVKYIFNKYNFIRLGNLYYSSGEPPFSVGMFSKVYVRSLAKANGLPSKITEIDLPTIKYGAPNVTIEKNSNGYIITNIEKCNNDIVINPKYEYFIYDSVQEKKLVIDAIISKINKKYKNATNIDTGIAYDDDDPWTYNDFVNWRTCAQKGTINSSFQTFSNCGVSFDTPFNEYDISIKVKIKLVPLSGSYICIRRKATEQNGLMILPSETYIFKIP